MRENTDQKNSEYGVAFRKCLEKYLSFDLKLTIAKARKVKIFPYSVRMRENKDQKKLRLYKRFTQWKKMKKIRVFFVKFEYLARNFKSYPSEVMKHKRFFNISALQI